MLLNSIAAGLAAPTQSAAGIIAATASPALSYKIGQEFKNLANQNADGKLTTSQETAHILAHAVLGAAIAAAGDNNALAGAISSVRHNKLKEIYSQDDLRREGGIGNAYRHVLWQALIANKFGSQIAMEAGNSHESFWGINTRYVRDTDLQNLSQADELVDQKNNEIGRMLVQMYPNKTTKEYAQLALDFYHDEGLYQATKQPNGRYTVEPVRLSTRAYEIAKQTLSGLDQTGAGATIREKRRHLKEQEKSK